MTHHPSRGTHRHSSSLIKADHIHRHLRVVDVVKAVHSPHWKCQVQDVSHHGNKGPSETQSTRGREGEGGSQAKEKDQRAADTHRPYSRGLPLELLLGSVSPYCHQHHYIAENKEATKQAYNNFATSIDIVE